MAIAAQLDESPDDPGRPREHRRRLRLQAQGATASGEAANVLVHNVSATGLLLETEVGLDVGERITIDLPHAGATWAQVVWSSQPMFGCQFDEPISSAALSAAQLRGPAGFAPDVPLRHDGLADEPFGVRLHRLRKQRGLSLAQVAAQLGVSKPTVWAWERGKARPVESRIDALAEALGLSSAELLPQRGGSALQSVLTRSRNEIAIAAGTLPERVRIFIEL